MGFQLRILLVEDEPRVSGFLQKGLQEEQFDVDLATDGERGLELALSVPYDLIVLDLMLPRLDGAHVLKNLRQQGITTPVVVLTARGGIHDRVAGLEAGADDYLVKPFAFEELLARIRALLRRQSRPDTVLRFADLEMDRVRRKVQRAGKPIELTPKEYGVLECLMENAGNPVTRAMIFERVWKSRSEGLTNLVDVYVNYLRAKMDRDFEPKLIQTVRGVGYTLKESDAKT